LGFDEDTREGAPICRWTHGSLILDVMPLDAQVLGFSNRWYPDVLRTAGRVQLPSGLVIRAINAPYFLGTKLEAFRGRGKRDYLASHDLEDFVTVVDGRSSLVTELEGASPELKTYVADSVRMLLAESRFLDALPGYLLPDEASQARIGQLMAKLRRLEAIR
jgi:hypothetical protein